MNVNLLKEAIKLQKQITCYYNWKFRECCPHVLGMKKFKYHCLVYQFWWETSKGQIVYWINDDRRCMDISKMQNIVLKDGERFSWNDKNIKPNSCIDNYY